MTDKKTFDVELFIHAPTLEGGDFKVFGLDMSEHGCIFLGSQMVTLDVPEAGPVMAELDMLEKKKAAVNAEYGGKLNAINDRINSLLAIEHKPEDV